ncbi:MAG TPA: VOC family protein [Solirubrobacteraceae bacterium]|nr:VOC family protein [Solirubrobacteraceae bacterium]
MTIVKFDHIGVVVDDLDAALKHFRKLFDFRDEDLVYERDYKDVDSDTGDVDVMHFALFPVGEVYFELIEPVSEGPMKRFLERTGGGIHHLGVTSNDLRKEWARHDGERESVGVIGDRPRVDQYNVSYWFLHPKPNYRVLFEVDAAWAKTSVSDMTPLEPTPDWAAELTGKPA